MKNIHVVLFSMSALANAFAGEAETDRNINWNTTNPEWRKNHLNVERKHNSEVKSVAADPLYADPANGDFSLHPDSPAFKIGFEPINFRRIGLRKGSDSAVEETE